MSATDVLRISDVKAGYGSIRVLEDVSLRVGKGEIVAIIGPNGAGKSTALKVATSELPPEAGSVWLSDEKITGMPTHHIIRKGLSYIPQGDVVFPWMSVEENLRMATFALGRDRARAGRERRDEVLDLFPELRGKLRQGAGSLSGGQQQMLALARALLTRPVVLLLDEPSLGLAPRFVIELAELLGRLRDGGLGVGLVEQNAAMALELCDRAYVMDMGRIRFEGSGEELLASDEVRNLYVGRRATSR